MKGSDGINLLLTHPAPLPAEDWVSAFFPRALTPERGAFQAYSNFREHRCDCGTEDRSSVPMKWIEDKALLVSGLWTASCKRLEDVLVRKRDEREQRCWSTARCASGEARIMRRGENLSNAQGHMMTSGEGLMRVPSTEYRVPSTEYKDTYPIRESATLFILRKPFPCLLRGDYMLAEHQRLILGY